jgi:hypothetical protein
MCHLQVRSKIVSYSSSIDIGGTITNSGASICQKRNAAPPPGNQIVNS